ncbi:MAG: hypothetical protein AB1635_08270 [Acidobacteriota bacterium]
MSVQAAQAARRLPGSFVVLIALASLAVALPAGAQAPVSAEDTVPTMARRAVLHVEAVVAPEAVAGSLLAAGVAHVMREPARWNRDAGGFGRRLASAVGVSAVNEGVQFAVGAWLGHDPRYRRRGRGGLLRRAGHAAVSTFVARDRHGRRVPAWLRLAGAYTAAAVSTSWYPESEGAGRYIASRGALVLGSNIVSNLWAEFRPDILP